MNEFLLFAREIFHILRFNSHLSSDLLVLQLQQGGGPMNHMIRSPIES